MLIDYERAWVHLQRFILSKPSHGQNQLLAEMARLTVEHKVAEGGLPALLRLYGVAIQTDAVPNDEGDAFPPAVARDLRRHLTPEEGHDGHDSAERTAA